MRKALYFEKKGEGRVRCLLCPKRCVIEPGRAGFCRARINRDGELWTYNYARCAALHLDPVEKKPLFHFYPGHTVLSLGTVGCNLACAFCQNWQISREDAPTVEVTPEDAVEMALARWAGDRCVGLAFTYNEPSVWFEYIMDTAPLAHERGLKNVLVTNGFIAAEPLADLLPHIDAFNVDVKGMTPRFYPRVCRGLLEPVLRTVETVYRAGRHVEVTNLLIPGENDSEESIRALVDWLAGVGEDIPLHFSRYHPDYRMTRPATPRATLERAREIARARLRYVYLGNTWRPGDDDTVCHACGRTVVVRAGFRVLEVRLRGNRCRYCGTPVAGVGWEAAAGEDPAE